MRIEQTIFPEQCENDIQSLWNILYIVGYNNQKTLSQMHFVYRLSIYDGSLIEEKNGIGFKLQTCHSKDLETEIKYYYSR